ncbi:phosphoglycerate mutase-like protein [Coniophora puteana RWD-64-598 SS2]|uniref:Phosphoglycerate mutase-like protein n=1 Tax=Coniophora puteana (strain RWD-64-598) TaxID=741705 RepID=A0A5M3MZR7_CONPW|nr:phosphoglycerate mutase-like protein [Coniophora puteana RWD-64-598 SS2]EIW84640.1 phosphoglycerate mutase-like protein [Coniophora puteana RWD-64-598 SS2]
MSEKVYKIPYEDPPDTHDILYSSDHATRSRRGEVLRVASAFALGALACVGTIAQLNASGAIYINIKGHAPSSPAAYNTDANAVDAFAPPWVGSTTGHEWPPAHPTNAETIMFPTNVGYPGPTVAAGEPGLVATAPHYAIHTGAQHIVVPTSFPKAKLPRPHAPYPDSDSEPGSMPVVQEDEDDEDDEDDVWKDEEPFDLFRHWGTLSPWSSVPRGGFGVDAGPEAPDGCRVSGLHLLHRHGARSPADVASGQGIAGFAERMNKQAADVRASGPLKFLNEWTLRLGAEGLSPFGRSQLFDLGVATRMRYGFLLQNFTATNSIPTFRTESQHRMLSSAQNFALGFFGYPLDGQYHQVIGIESQGFNNSLAPYRTCTNSADPAKGWASTPRVNEWKNIYLKDALPRLQRHIRGFTLTVDDVYSFQEACAYETVVLGYSAFCALFTKREWDGFDYAQDINYWYNVAFGSPLAKGQGIGYVQELVARLEHRPIQTHNSSTNATLHEPQLFPLNDPLYVDATHEVVVLNIITALNLTSFTGAGPLPSDRIPRKRTFRSSQLTPFATNVQFQLLSCAAEPEEQIRVIINDGVVPLDGVRGCGENRLGMCAVKDFVEAQKASIQGVDWAYICDGDWTIPDGWNTTDGLPPGYPDV